MRRSLSLILAVLCWFAVLTQFVLMYQNNEISFVATVVRFFSYFTILTNTLAAVWFTFSYIKNTILIMGKGGLTALTLYISVVGLVYQFALRSIWEPQGLQMVVDELLHSVNPLCVLLFWFLFQDKQQVSWKQIPMWLIYPVAYLFYILVQGVFTHWYPYPFLNLNVLNTGQLVRNILILVLVFVFLGSLYVGLAKIISRKN